MKNRILLLVIALFAMTFNVTAQVKVPELEHVMDLKVQLGESFGVGETAQGNRFVIPITGGTFEGPKVKGEILNGGADYQLIHKDKNRTDLEAIYCIRTDDGVSIHVRNVGIAAGNYFYTSPKFEAPLNSPYAWLNNGIYVCKPVGFMKNGITLRVWIVRDAQ